MNKNKALKKTAQIIGVSGECLQLEQLACAANS